VTAFLVQPDVRHERTSTADCNTVRVHRLSVDELAQLDVNSLTPLQAINKLYEWKQRYTNERR